MRKLILVFLCFYCMSASSCRVIRPSANHILLTSKEDETMLALAKNLSEATGFELSKDDDLGLYAFVADWKGVPYRYGGTSMKGTDCSAFAMNLLNEVYGLQVPRTSAAGLMNLCKPIPKKDLKEGDMVFFNIRNRRGGQASHVGVYLRQGLFVHASTSSGVIISSLKQPIYRRTFIGAGDIRDQQ